jgi:hypothetical protein
LLGCATGQQRAGNGEDGEASHDFCVHCESSLDY